MVSPSSKDRVRRHLEALDARLPRAEVLAPQVEDSPQDNAVRCTRHVPVPADARPWEPLVCRLPEPPDAPQDAPAALLAAPANVTFRSTRKGR